MTLHSSSNHQVEEAHPKLRIAKKRLRIRIMRSNRSPESRPKRELKLWVRAQLL